MELSSENVDKIFKDCLFLDGEDTSNHVKSEGIQSTVGFHPERLESYRDDVADMLNYLPDEFQKTGGSGWSFLNACNDKDGRQWTDLHQKMEQLFQLGIGLNLAKWQLPREMWKMFPGSMPYAVVDTKVLA